LGDALAIYRLFQDEKFGAEDIERMSKAYETALELLHLPTRTEPLSEVIAAKIIQVYRAGERDPPRICARAIRELGVPLIPL
jgi:hypothetical protein